MPDEVANAGENSATLTGKTEAAQSSTQDGSTTADTVMINVGGEQVAVPRDEIANLYNKKATNLEKHYQKRYQDVSVKEKQFEAAISKLDNLDKIINQLQAAGQSRSEMDPEQAQIEEAKQIVKKMIAEELKPISERISSFDAEKAAAQITTETKSIVDSSSLDDKGKSFFVNYFVGKYNVDRIPLQDGVDNNGRERQGLYSLMRDELKDFEKTWKEKSLINNEKYVKDKQDTHKKNRTDNTGNGGRSEGEGVLKGKSGRERRMAKEDILNNIVSRLGSPGK